MAAAPAFAKLKAGDGDHFHAGGAHFGDGMRIAFISNNHAWFQGDRVIGIIPLLPLHLIMVSARLDNIQLSYLEGVRNSREEILLHGNMKIALLFSRAQTDRADLLERFLHGEGTPQAQEWLKERLHRLKHEGPQALLVELDCLQAQQPDAQEISGNLAYLKKREQQIQYPRFQVQDWPIASGIVESGNKLVVEVRLKGSGMHWAEQHVNPMLALRNIVCSRRWKEDWPKIETRLRQQANQRKRELHQSRIRPTPISVPATTMITPAVPTLPSPIPPAKPKDPKDNPWRKFKFGRALYQRHDLPKI